MAQDPSRGAGLGITETMSRNHQTKAFVASISSLSIKGRPRDQSRQQ
jgi:hypothetical protein